jgi:hypothetical protein
MCSQVLQAAVLPLMPNSLVVHSQVRALFAMPSDVDPRGLFVVTLRLFLFGQDLVV